MMDMMRPTSAIETEEQSEQSEGGDGEKTRKKGKGKSTRKKKASVSRFCPFRLGGGSAI